MLASVWKERTLCEWTYTWEYQTDEVLYLLTSFQHVHFLVFSDFLPSYSRLVFSYPNIHNSFLGFSLCARCYPFCCFIENGEKRIHRNVFLSRLLHWRSSSSVTILQLRLKVETRVWSFRPLEFIILFSCVLFSAFWMSFFFKYFDIKCFFVKQNKERKKIL